MPLPQNAPLQAALTSDFVALDAERQVALITEANPLDDKGRYLAWDQIRYREPPAGLDGPSVLVRHGHGSPRLGSHAATLGTRRVNRFWYCNAPPLLAALNRLDQAQGTHILGDERHMTIAFRRRWLQRGLMEEAIQSSRLEGASSTRELAREMLRESRPPRDESERMIANNFSAMQVIEGWAGTDESVDLDHILRLHRVVTDGTLHDDRHAGAIATARRSTRLRRVFQSRSRAPTTASGRASRTDEADLQFR